MSDPWKINLLPGVVLSGGVDDDEIGIGVGIPSLETGVIIGGADTNGDGNVDTGIIGGAVGGHGIIISSSDLDHDGFFDTEIF